MRKAHHSTRRPLRSTSEEDWSNFGHEFYQPSRSASGKEGSARPPMLLLMGMARSVGGDLLEMI